MAIRPIIISMKVTITTTITDVDKDMLIILTDEQVTQLGVKEGDTITRTMAKVGHQDISQV